jgi:adenosylcobinamide-GDP ribazoletransferase
VKSIANQFRLILVATQFLTRLPISRSLDAWIDWTPERLRASARYFPLVGIGVGLIGAVALWAATPLWGSSLAAILSLACTTLITGAFHEDGFVDYADSFGGTSRDRALAIMKDSRIGTFGALAVVFLVAIKAFALASMSIEAGVAALILAHCAGRSVACMLMRSLPYLRDKSGKAKPLAEKVKVSELAVALGTLVATLAAAVGFALPLVRAAVVIAALLVFTWWFHTHLQRRLGGFTGDALGAAEQTAEMIVLLVLSASVVSR